MEIDRSTSADHSTSPSIYYTPRSSYHSNETTETIKEEVKQTANQIIQGIFIAYRDFKKKTDETNKWLWIRGQKPQMQQALDRSKLTPAAFANLPWHQFLDPDYIRSKWIDKNIDFALVLIRILNPKINVTKKNIHEIPKILLAFINNNTFLEKYTQILMTKKQKKQKFLALQAKVDEEYTAFMEDLRNPHKDPYGFELGPIAEQHLRDKMTNDFVGNKMKSAGVIHTSRIGTYWKGGSKKTRKKYRNKNTTKKYRNKKYSYI